MNEFINYILDLLKFAGSARARKMFGGYGIYLQEIMIALVEDNILYLKADDSSRHHFEELGLPRFTYLKQGKPVRLSFYQAPDEVLDNSEEMKKWAQRAHKAALRSRK